MCVCVNVSECFSVSLSVPVYVYVNVCVCVCERERDKEFVNYRGSCVYMNACLLFLYEKYAPSFLCSFPLVALPILMFCFHQVFIHSFIHFLRTNMVLSVVHSNGPQIVLQRDFNCHQKFEISP